MSGSYMLEEIRSDDDFLDLRDEWNKLVSEDPTSTIFQTWEWNFSVWKYEGSRLKSLNVLLIREEGGNLVGIAPFYSYEKIVFGLRTRMIELIGKNFSNYRGFIVKPEDDIRVYNKILSWLNENSMSWDIVDLRFISEESLVIKNHDTLFRGLNFRPIIRQQYICPYIILYPDRDLYGNLYNQSLVKHLKRKTRKLERDHSYRFITISSPSELDGYLDKLFDLHKKRRNHKLQRGMFHSEDQERLFKNLSRSLLERDCLRLSFILVDNEPAACLYNLEFKNKIYSYQSGLDPKFDKYSLGYVNDFLAVREALKGGVEEYDFLSGNESYKKEWTQNYRSVYRVQIVSSDFKKAALDVNEKLLDFFYNSKLYHSKLVRKLYFSLKNLGKLEKEVG